MCSAQSRSYLVVFIGLLVGVWGYAQEYSLRDDSFIPMLTNGNTQSVVYHQNFVLSYSEEDEQAYWVTYALTKQEISNRNTKRQNDFRIDPKIATGSASPEDYLRSGFDKGHLAPSADFLFSSTANSETFYMSNISPQNQKFNRGIWRELEIQVRIWTEQYNEVYVISAGLLNQEYLAKIGRQRVSVPRYYYKIVYIPAKEIILAFLMENTNLRGALQNYVVSVDTLETLTAFDFFVELNREDLESHTFVDLVEWSKDFKDPVSSVQLNNPSTSSVSTTQTSQEKQSIHTPEHSDPEVKMSQSGICHSKTSPYYEKTKNFTPYETLERCIEVGGRLPKTR